MPCDLCFDMFNIVLHASEHLAEIICRIGAIVRAVNICILYIPARGRHGWGRTYSGRCPPNKQTLVRIYRLSQTRRELDNFNI